MNEGDLENRQVSETIMTLHRETERIVSGNTNNRTSRKLIGRMVIQDESIKRTIGLQAHEEAQWHIKHGHEVKEGYYEFT